MNALILSILNLAARYALRALALHSQGFLGFVGLAKETTWGTGVAATDYFSIMSENFTESIDRFAVRNAIGAFNEPDDFAGVKRIVGDLSMYGQPLSIGHLLKAVFNTVSQSTVLSGFLYNNNFCTVHSEFADGVPSQPYTFEVYRDVTSSFRILGAVCNRLALSLAPNQDLRATASFIGKSVALLAKTTPSFPGSSVSPFAFDTASLTLASAATARIEAFNLTIDNFMDGIPALNNTSVIARLRRRDAQQVRFGGTLDFQDYTEYLDFTNQTERNMVVALTRADSFALVLDMPRFVYSAFPLGTPGRGRMTVAFNGMARFLTSSDVAIQARLTTTKSNF